MPQSCEPPRSRRTVHTLLTLAVVAGVVAATGASIGSGARTAGTTAVGRAVSDYIVLDWQQRAAIGPVVFSFPTYDRLVSFSKDLSKIVPSLAESWVAVPKNRPKQVTFTLKKGIKCGDGHELTVIDVLNSFKRFIEVPKISNQLPAFFGPGPYGLHANVKKRTFTFRTQTPFANMIYGFAQSGIICPAGLAALRTDPQALNKTTYGTGAYNLVSAVHNDQVVYQKKTEWKWGPAGTNLKTMPDTLVVKIVPDQTTAANLLVTGGVDYGPINGPDVSRLRASSSLQHKTFPNFYPVPLVFNQHPGRVTTNPKVRQALMTAFDPKDFAQAAWGKPAIGAGSFVHPTDPCYDKTIAKYLPKPSTAEARRILQSDGYTPNSSGIMTKGGQTLKISLLASPDLLGSAGEYLAAQFKAAGFDVDLRDLPGNIYPGQYVSAIFDVAPQYAFQYFPSRGYNLNLVSGPPPPRGGNHPNAGVGDNEYQRAALLAQQRTDCEWWIKLQRLMVQKFIAYPLGSPAQDGFGNKKWDFPAPNFLDPAWLTPYKGK